MIWANPITAFKGVRNAYTVSLPGVAHPYVFLDHHVDDDYPYLVTPTGVADEGTPVATRPEAPHLMRAVGLGRDERVALLKVSQREGGFEAVNTYDTGYVSVGFIQFAAMKSGTGSLTKLLERMRSDSPQDFHHYFQAYGIDVDDQDRLCAIDPSTGRVLHGDEAVSAIIADKRLTAVFSHAGAGSEAFQKAQIAQAADVFYAPSHDFRLRVAKVTDHYDPAHPLDTYCYGDDAISAATQLVASENASPWQPLAPTSGVPYTGPRYTLEMEAPLTGRYGRIFQSQAGRTAITDRCVQRGYEAGPKKQGLAAKFAEAVGVVANGRRVTVQDLAGSERDLISVVQNRILVLADSTLGQPGDEMRVASKNRANNTTLR